MANIVVCLALPRENRTNRTKNLVAKVKNKKILMLFHWQFRWHAYLLTNSLVTTRVFARSLFLRACVSGPR